MNWNWFGNHIQVVVIIVALAGSGISWIYNKLREQAAIRQAQADRQRRVEESLRTGRDPGGEQTLGQSAPPSARAPSSAAEARERLGELARRRQAQIEAARRQAQVRIPSAPSALPPSRPPPIIIMGPSGPIQIPRPGQAPRPVQRSGQAPVSSRTAPPPFVGRQAPAPTQRTPQPQRAQPQRQQQQRQPQKRRPDQPQRPQQTAPRPSSTPTMAQRPPEASPARVEAPIAASEPGAARAMLRLPPVGARSAADYRRALAMIEVLSPPLALRDGEGPVTSAF
jgi:hypothetical protein